MVTPSAPWPARHGASVRNAAFVTALSKRYDVDVVALCSSREQALSHPDARTTTLVRTKGLSRSRLVLNAATSRTPQLVFRHRSKEFRAVIQNHLAVGDVNTVQIEGLQLAHIVNDVASGTEGKWPRPNVVYDAHNVEWHLQSMLAGLSQGMRAWYSRRQAALLYDVERWVVSAADATVAASEADAVALGSIGGREVVAVPHPVDVSKRMPNAKSESRTPRVLLAANFGYRPNVLGAEWLFGSVWPQVVRRVPDAVLRVVGPGSSGLRNVAPARCTIGGIVDDFDAEQRRAWVSISPNPVGSGAPLKVLHSLAQGRPVVVRAEGFAGLPRALDGVVIADSSEDFADRIVDLLQDSKRRRLIGRAGRAYVLKHHEPGKTGKMLLQVHERLDCRGARGLGS